MLEFNQMVLHQTHCDIVNASCECQFSQNTGMDIIKLIFLLSHSCTHLNLFFFHLWWSDVCFSTHRSHSPPPYIVNLHNFWETRVGYWFSLWAVSKLSLISTSLSLQSCFPSYYVLLLFSDFFFKILAAKEFCFLLFFAEFNTA